MLFFYNLREFLKAFLLLSLVFASLLSFYAVVDVFLLYKVPKVELIPKVMLISILISFYYITPIINGLCLMLYLKRIFSKSYDRISNAFGVSPLSFLSPVILFSLVLSFVQLALSYSMYPKVFKTVYLIEKEFKRGEAPEELVLSNLWLSLNAKGENLHVRIGLADLKKNQVYDVFLLSLRDNYITKLISAKEGYWEGERLKLKGAEINLFEKEVQEHSDITLNFIPMQEAKAFGENFEHLSMDRLLALYMLASKIDMNKEPYLAELLRRMIASFSNILVIVPLSLHLLKERAFLKPFAFFLLYGCIYVLSLSSVKIVAEQLGRSPIIGFAPYMVLILAFVRSFYYLGKGYRI